MSALGLTSAVLVVAITATPLALLLDRAPDAAPSAIRVDCDVLERSQGVHPAIEGDPASPRAENDSALLMWMVREHKNLYARFGEMSAAPAVLRHGQPETAGATTQQLQH